jgi:hypothetical protein
MQTMQAYQHIYALLRIPLLGSMCVLCMFNKLMMLVCTIADCNIVAPVCPGGPKGC